MPNEVDPSSYAAVLDDPDADAPRIAYAAACESAGDDERAEFIRLQINAVSRMRAGQAGFSSSRVFQLQARNRDAWAGSIRTQVNYVQFFRGFVEKIAIDAREFLAHASELYSLAPIRRLTLTGVVPVLEELFSSPHLGRIAWLNLEGQKIGDEGVAILAASPHLRKLAYLGLSMNNVTLAGIETLAASPNLPALKDLALSGNPGETASEMVYDDQGKILGFTRGSPDGAKIEQKYGRKTWLHTVEDHGYREVWEDEF